MIDFSNVMLSKLETAGMRSHRTYVLLYNNVSYSDVSNTILSNMERTETSFLNIERTRTCSSIDNRT